MNHQVIVISIHYCVLKSVSNDHRDKSSCSICVQWIKIFEYFRIQRNIRSPGRSIWGYVCISRSREPVRNHNPLPFEETPTIANQFNDLPLGGCRPDSCLLHDSIRGSDLKANLNYYKYHPYLISFNYSCARMYCFFTKEEPEKSVTVSDAICMRFKVIQPWHSFIKTSDMLKETY